MAGEFEGMAQALQIPQSVLNNIDKIDKKINLIASDSEKMATHFMSAMTRMGTGAGDLLQRLQSIQNIINTLGDTKMGGIGNVSKGFTEASKAAESTANSITKAAEAMNRYGNTSTKAGKKSTFDRERQEYVERYKMYERMFDQIKRVEQQQAKLDSRLRRSNYQSYVTSTEGALRTAGRANTFAQREQAIKNLESAMKRLNVSDKNYEANLKRLTTAYKNLRKQQEAFQKNMGKVSQSSHNLMDISGQLARRLALVFSVSSITGFINKMIQVRGEFELQQTALASILDSKDKANELFAQITDLAVQSPYTIKELNSYTKQLAAYQIQYEDLYDTLKRLADVSSGLGVDMGRLILAFGQVKAANFLRGTEVRQFTEAGLNILGELAKYYSELEGRMISVGEVQEMVSKRMVSFGDVEEVFKRVTSAGGMFYDMQIKQSQTLRGQMMNLQDQYDLMLNELGQSSQGMINDFISFVKSALENWETIAQVMRPILGFLGTYFLLTNKWFGLIPIGVKVWTALKTVLASIPPIQHMMNLQQQKFNKLTKTNMWLLVLGLIATAVWEVIEAFNAANKKAEEFNRIADEAHNDAKLSIAQYRRLANTVTDTTKTYQEQEAALKELQRVYQDILPDQYLQIDSIRALKGEYEGAEQAILNYMKARAQERQINFIEEEYGQNVQDTRDNLIEDIQSRVAKLYDVTIPEIDLGNLIDKAEKEIEEGTIKYYGDFYDKLTELVSGYLDKEVEHLGVTETSLAYFNQVKGMYDAISNVLQGNTVGFGSQIEREMQTMRDDTQDVIDEMNRLLNVISHMDEVGADGVLITEKQVKEAKKNLAELLKNYGITIDEINKLTGDAWEIRDVSDKFTRAILKGLQNSFAKLKTSSLNGLGNILRGITDIDDEIKKMDNTPFQDYVEGMIEDAAKLEKIDLGRFVRYLPQDMETVDEFTKRIKNKIEQLESDITKYDKHPSLIQQWFGKPEERDEAERELNVLRIVLAGLVDEANKNRGSGKDQRLKQLEDNIKLLEEAYKRYKELNEELSDTESAQMTRNMFADTPISDVVATMTFDASGMIEGLQALYEQASKGVSTTLAKSMDDARKDASRPFETEVLLKPKIEERERLEKQIEGMFDQYDLSVELMGEGLSPDLIKSLFGVNILDMDTLKKEIQSMQPIFEAAGLNWQEVWEKVEANLTERTEKELKERLKQYAQYLNQSLSARAKAELKYRDELDKLEKTEEVAPEQKDAIKQTLKVNYEQELGKINWEEFQNSDVYTQLFKDLEYVSTAAIKRIKANLDGLKKSLGTLSPEQLKSLNEYYSKLDDELSRRNPFAAMAESLRAVNALQKKGKSKEVLEANLLTYDAEAKLLKQQIADLEIIAGAKERGYDLDNMNIDVLNRVAQILGVQTSEMEKQTAEQLRQEANSKRQSLTDVQGKITDTNEDLDIYENAAKDANNLGNVISKIGELGKSAFGQVSGMLDAMGVSMNENEEAIGGIIDGTFSIVQGIGQMIVMAQVFGVALNSALGIIGWIAMALQAVTMIFTAIARIHDNKIQKQIDAEQDKVEQLQKAYKKLEKAIDDAYSTDTLKSANQSALKNLDQQEASIRKMMELEQDKKHPDEDAIKEYQNQLDALEETREQLIEEMQSPLTGGIFDDIISAAEQFTQAWLDAFNETGDGLKGLEENFDELLRTLLIRQATMQVVSPLVEKMAKELEKYINVDDADLTVPEAEAWANYSKSLLEPMSENLKNIFTAWKNAGLDIFGSDELSGLQKGIQSITEETALALEALLNSIRFYVSDIRTVNRNMYSILFETPEMSPYYQQMLLQTQYLRSINDLVIATSTYSTNNGRVLKVKVV